MDVAGDAMPPTNYSVAFNLKKSKAAINHEPHCRGKERTDF